MYLFENGVELLGSDGTPEYAGYSWKDEGIAEVIFEGLKVTQLNARELSK